MAKKKEAPAPDNALKADRNADIIASYDPQNNCGYKTLARRHGITEQRVKQIIIRARERGELA